MVADATQAALQGVRELAGATHHFCIQLEGKAQQMLPTV